MGDCQALLYSTNSDSSTSASDSHPLELSRQTTTVYTPGLCMRRPTLAEKLKASAVSFQRVGDDLVGVEVGVVVASLRGLENPGGVRIRAARREPPRQGSSCRARRSARASWAWAEDRNRCSPALRWRFPLPVW